MHLICWHTNRLIVPQKDIVKQRMHFYQKCILLEKLIKLCAKISLPQGTQKINFFLKRY